MNQNPYQSPPTPPEPRETPGTVQFREFRGSAFSISTRKMMTRLRREVERFIEHEVGAANVINICEHTGLEHSITVWYRV